MAAPTHKARATHYLVKYLAELDAGGDARTLLTNAFLKGMEAGRSEAHSCDLDMYHYDAEVGWRCRSCGRMCCDACSEYPFGCELCGRVVEVEGCAKCAAPGSCSSCGDTACASCLTHECTRCSSRLCRFCPSRMTFSMPWCACGSAPIPSSTKK